MRARPLSSSTIIVQWAMPDTPNGVLKGYYVYYTTSPNTDLTSWFSVPVDATRSLTTISDLVTMQIYSVSVSAFTSVGEGPASTPIQVKTQQGGKYHTPSLLHPSVTRPLSYEKCGQSLLQFFRPFRSKHSKEV